MLDSHMRRVVARDLGLIDYEEALALQRRLQHSLIEAKRTDAAALPPHSLLLLEHPHTYTLGKSGDDSNLLLNEVALKARGATFHRIGRGGDITYHGPGQLVGYPILDLDRFFTDLGRYLRTLEECVIHVCASYGIDAGRVDGRTGVWVGPDERGPERKICAMGIRCSRWVTMHGFAFNVTTDLDYYDHIIPCGISDRGVTSLQKELGREVSMSEAKLRFTEAFEALFDAKVVSLGTTA